MKRDELRVRVAQIAGDRLEVVNASRQLAERRVQVQPAAGERVAELDQVRLDRDARGLVEGRKDIVELDRLGHR